MRMLVMVISYHDVLRMHAGGVKGVKLVTLKLYSSGIIAVLLTYYGGGLVGILPPCYR